MNILCTYNVVAVINIVAGEVLNYHLQTGQTLPACQRE